MAETATVLAQFGPVVPHDDPAKRFADLTLVIAERTGPGSDIAKCLPALFTALDWRGDSRDLAEALTDKEDLFDVTALRNTMARLGFGCREMTPEKAVKDGRLPGLLLPERSPAMVVAATHGKDEVLVYDTATDAITELPLKKLKGRFLYFCEETETPQPPRRGEALKAYFKRYSGLAGSAIMLTAVSSVLALSVPIFVLLTYDRFIPTGSMATLVSLISGVTLALLTDLAVRRMRRNIISFISARIGLLVGTAIFSRLLRLPVGMTESASISSQVARARDIDRLKEFISGPAGGAVLDLPFVIIFISVIAIIAGWLAVIPVIAAGFFALGGFALARIVSNGAERTARLNSDRQEIMMEIIQNLRAIKAAGGVNIWIRRYEAISRLSVKENFRNTRLATGVSTLSQSITMLAGLAAVGLGTTLAIDGSISTGALIASMILVWRALSPMQVAFVMLTRVDQLRKSVTQINRLFDFPPEQAEGILLASAGGHIEFSQVMFKYPGETDPVVSNLSMVASRGDLVAIVGKNGAGKSSVLKLISGLYPPLVGRIRIDNCDIRQIQPRQLRQLISYVPQSPQFFHGSVYDNLLMSQPMATRDEIIAALDDAGAWEEIKKFPQQIDTFLDVRQNEFFPSSLVMRIALARVYLRQSPIVLFDEPITGLDFESEFLFTSALEQMRQTSTIFLVTHRPSHLRIANKILLLEGGVCRYFGPAAEVRDKISAQLI